MHNFPRVGKGGGGIVIYVKCTHLSDVCQNINAAVLPSSFEFACINLMAGTCKVTVLCLYRPPNPHTMETFFDEFDELISVLPSEPNSLVICGDYSIDALDSSSHFNNLVASHLPTNSYPVIFLPTRVTPTSSTLIDHIFCNFEHVVSSGVFDERISDHFPIFVLLKLPIEIPSVDYQQYRTFRPITNKGINLMRMKLIGQDWSFITPHSNVNSDYENLTAIHI
jgi:hypothetical protein